MFGWCFTLKSLPDISKWNINNVKDIGTIFGCCYDLSSLPDISKWNIIILMICAKYLDIVDH